MSTWTSKLARLALVAVGLSLAGCGGFRGGSQSSEPDPLTRPAERAVAVTDDQVVIAGPQGYCVDSASTRDRGSTGFVLLGNCAVLTNNVAEGQPGLPSVLTASVSDADPENSLGESIPVLDGFFRSEEGRALLSRAGEAETVEILDSFHQGDVFYLSARDSSAGDIQNVTEEYWRAYVDIGARIATLTVLGVGEDPFSTEDSLDTLRQFTDAVVLANAEASAPDVAVASLPDATATPQTPPTVPPQLTSGNGTLWNVGLFRRIIGR